MTENTHGVGYIGVGASVRPFRRFQSGSAKMTDCLLFALTFFSALGSGLMAGLFFTFSAFVMTGLGRIPPAGGISAMQSINVAILNPLFFAAFFGTAATCLLLAIAAPFRWAEPAAFYLLAGSVLYLVGSLLVTIVFNVPMNDALAAVKPDSAEGASLWTGYLSIGRPGTMRGRLRPLRRRHRSPSLSATRLAALARPDSAARSHRVSWAVPRRSSYSYATSRRSLSISPNFATFIVPTMAATEPCLLRRRRRGGVCQQGLNIEAIEIL